MRIEIVDNLEYYRKKYYINNQEVFTEKEIKFCIRELEKQATQNKNKFIGKGKEEL